MLQRSDIRYLLILPLLVMTGAVAALGIGESAPAAEMIQLDPVVAVGVRYDTLLLGGYAAGSFTEAVREIAGDLSESERTMVGQHLDRVFSGVLDDGGLGRSGRLRAVFERALRPDGSTRSVRVLAAEAAVAGRLHDAFFFERADDPGYYDSFGRSLDGRGWAQPLETLRVSSPFGLRRVHPILNRVLPHTGVDYAAPSGTPVRATGDGMVVFAGERGGYGNLVEIQHPSGYATRYAHLSSVAPGVAASRQIREGEVIGFVGMTGLATGPHLHYEMRAHGRAVDPQRATAASAGPRQLGSSIVWVDEHRRLTSLLAQAPTIVAGSRTANR